MNGPMDVPGGRVAQMMDPQGAAFALHQGVKK
jgi:predicted enzyme related to lactoylglutathione lyase